MDAQEAAARKLEGENDSLAPSDACLQQLATVQLLHETDATSLLHLIELHKTG